MTAPMSLDSAQDIVRAFNRLYYQARTYSKVSWHGVQLLKYPTDLIVYQELIWRVRPSVIIETGTFAGGSALFFAEQLDAVGDGIVVTIDVQDWSGPDGYPTHERIRYLSGSSLDLELRHTVHAVAGGAVMVVLDSAHTAEHVLGELEAYAPLVTPGSYLIVEDTNVHDVAEYGAGPDDALAQWLPDHPEFIVDRECERFMLTAAPGGWLRRV